MPGYTKLFNSIITSTLWLEPDHTRLVWITMLALADKNGEIQASVPGLAKLAGVPVEACRTALECLLSPDPDSRTKEAEGRRIVEIEGGWELINHAKYRKMASEEDAREANARRQARHRARNAGVTPSNGASRDDNAKVTPEDHKQRADPHAKADAKSKSNNTLLPDDAFVDELQKELPGVNVRLEYGKARTWILANPDRKLTRKFFQRWVSKAASAERTLDLPGAGNTLHNQKSKFGI